MTFPATAVTTVTTQNKYTLQVTWQTWSVIRPKSFSTRSPSSTHRPHLPRLPRDTPKISGTHHPHCTGSAVRSAQKDSVTPRPPTYNVHPSSNTNSRICRGSSNNHITTYAPRHTELLHPIVQTTPPDTPSCITDISNILSFRHAPGVPFTPACNAPAPFTRLKPLSTLSCDLPTINH